MKKPLHPAFFAVATAACLALFAGVFVKFGSGVPAKSSAASPYTNVGELPKSAGSGVNSLTGEPLPETAKEYATSSFNQYTAPKTGRRP